MNPVIDLPGIKEVISGIGDQISTAINIEKVKKMIPRTNLLDNWWFGNPVNQRGQLVYDAAPASYTIDRWKTGGASTNRTILEIKPEIGAIKLSIKEGYSIASIRQLLEMTVSEDTVVTASALYKGSIRIYADGMPPTDVDPHTSDDWGVASYTYTIPAGTNLALSFGPLFGIADDDSDCYLKAVKLEFGEYQTLAHQDDDGSWVLNDLIPNYSDELHRCYRYLQPIVAGATCSITKITTTNQPALSFTNVFPVPMRIKPVLLQNNVHVYYSLGYDSVWLDPAVGGVGSGSRYSVAVMAVLPTGADTTNAQLWTGISKGNITPLLVTAEL